VTYFTVESDGFYDYLGFAWQNSLGVDGYEFETSPPQICPDGASKPHQPSGARTPNSRTAFQKSSHSLSSLRKPNAKIDINDYVSP
jgi:hypothetical protein